MRGHSSPWALRTPFGPQAGLGQAYDSEPRHFGSHNVGRDLFISTGETMGLVFLPNPGMQLGVRETNNPPLPHNSSAMGTFIPLQLRTTHGQEGASTDSGAPLAHGLFGSLSLWTALANLRVSRNVSASPTLTGPLVSKQTVPTDSCPTYLTIRYLGLGHICPSWAVKGL